MVDSINESSFPIKADPNPKIVAHPTVKKAHEAAKSLGVGENTSQIQGRAIKLTLSERTQKLGEAIQQLASHVPQKMQLQSYLNEFRAIQGFISDFEKSPPLNADDQDSITYHQHSLSVIRDQLQQMRSQASEFRDSKAKEAVLAIADELTLRLDELVKDKIDAAAFLSEEPINEEIMAMSDDELHQYLADGDNSSLDENPETLAGLKEEFPELFTEEKIPEGEAPDPLPKKLNIDPNKESL